MSDGPKATLELAEAIAARTGLPVEAIDRSGRIDALMERAKFDVEPLALLLATGLGEMGWNAVAHIPPRMTGPAKALLIPIYVRRKGPRAQHVKYSVIVVSVDDVVDYRDAAYPSSWLRDRCRVIDEELVSA